MVQTDDWVEVRRRRNRVRAIVVAVAVLGGAGFFLFSKGQEKAKSEATMLRLEGLLATGDLEPLKTAAREAGTILSEDFGAPAGIATVDSRAQLLVWMLYTGVDSQRFRSRESLDTAIERGPAEPTTLVTQAFWEAVVGSPDVALDVLSGGGAGAELPDWQAMARGEAMLRKGDLDGAAQALASVTTPVGRLWAIRVAWRRGDLDVADEHARAILAVSPGHASGAIAAQLVAARREGGPEAIERLGALLEGDTPLSARDAAKVTVELSRQYRRNGQLEQADQLLERYLEKDETSLELQREYARVQRFQGLFGAARTRADKALRSRPDEPDLLTELAQSAFFNDAPAMIRDRVRSAPEGAEGSDGVIRALALASLIEGNNALAIDGLRSTRHLGVPGETELWLAEAYLRSGQPEQAREEAARAAELLAPATGEGSREVATARMYEGLAMAMAGEIEPGRELMDRAFVDPNQTPWGAWLFGRFHEQAQDPASAKNAYLLACHNGQDFALSCLDLARIYDALPGSAIRRRTQHEAREHYLRSSPKGWHAAEVREALGR